MNILICLTAASLTYPVVDTGQLEAYGLEKGQDAHYAMAQPSYKDNGNGTVSDLVTGLMWTKAPGEKKTWSEAVKGASTCRAGGYKDWRLPTIKELYSLINFTGTDPDPRLEETGKLVPFIDRSVFDFNYGDPEKGERIIDSQFATSTLYVSTTMGGNKTMFGVNFADGRIKGYPVGKIGPRGEKTYFVLYVRRNPGYGKNEFKDNGDGTITDEATGLTWMKADSGKGMDWPSALEYAGGMYFAGHSDWRLPTVKELQSIVDYTRSPDTTDSAAIDPIFECTRIENEDGEDDYGHYWSSTTHIGGSTDRAAYLCFGRGLGFMRGEWMDVHGAGCQRSDQKTGDESQLSKGHGPQGDAQRINNMVRLVRGGGAESVKAAVRKSPKQSINRFIQNEDRNGDGRVSKGEFHGPSQHFDRFDRDGDGYITEEEAPQGPPKRRD
jgi:hypothetical protein